MFHKKKIEPPSRPAVRTFRQLPDREGPARRPDPVVAVPVRSMEAGMPVRQRVLAGTRSQPSTA